MRSQRFADRLSADTYTGDPLVAVYESSLDEADAVWLSERLFMRLALTAKAYELHTLPLLGGTEPVRLHPAQCEALLDELQFVADRLNDPLAVDAAKAVAQYVVGRRGSGTGVTVEGE
jgi:hypothetical protein